MLLGIPAEVTEHTLVLADPNDVASFAQTCRQARAIVYSPHDQHLWRRLFQQQPFDDPRHSSSKVDWRNELQRRMHAIRVIELGPLSEQIVPALETLIHVVRDCPPMTEKAEKTGQSLDLLWVHHLIADNKCLESLEVWPAEEQRQAELWSLVGWRVASAGSQTPATLNVAISRTKRTAARCFVYDLRNYHRSNHWGPFISDRDWIVNWKHVRSIIEVVLANLHDLPSLWSDTRPPIHLDAIRAYSAPGSNTRKEVDWAGVEGTWRRYVCFMDYRDLYTFNYSHHGGPYDPAFFDDEDFQEATRLIELKLKISRVEYLHSSPPSPVCSSPGSEGSASSDSSFVPSCSPSSSRSSSESSETHSVSSTPATSPIGSSAAEQPIASSSDGHTNTEHGTPYNRPVLHFEGTSRGGSGNEAKVRGFVRMTEDGNIRWRFASIYDGHTQWSSEGVQIGQVGSAAGIIGIWTGAHHEDRDPAGPFWLWKVKDDHPSVSHSFLFD